MRNWQLSSGHPLALRLAADARQFYTDYTDDQIWDLSIGQGQSPALALETRFGGRCGLARLVPMWLLGDRVLYEAGQFAGPPVLHNFTPSYARITARPAPHLAVQAEFWVITSHVLGGRFTFLNESDKLIETGVDLFAQVMTESKAGKINILTLDDGQFALHMKQVGNLNPVVLMHAVKTSSKPSPKLAARVSVPPGERTAIRWVHAARPDVRDSLALAYHWLYKEDWTAHLETVRVLADAVPEIETGDLARDAAIGFSHRVALGSIVGPTGELPYPSVVMARTPARGFSARGTGDDHYWQWAGQRMPETYLTALAIAPTSPYLAEGLVRNALAGQADDGFVDAHPGLAGQRSGSLCMPLLATLAWQVYGYTGRRQLLDDTFSGLVRFFERWFAPDVDADQDGVPEWQLVSQTGLVNNPTFAPSLAYSQQADIRFAETPQLVALLAREARSLLAIAKLLDDRAAAPRIQARLDSLLAALDDLWDDEAAAFRYRDRDTHNAPTGVFVAEGPGDQVLIPSLELQPANRLVVRVNGGRDHQPTALAVTLEGIGPDGEPIEEVLPAELFSWYRRGGAATSRHVYARIDRVTAEGLSRVYTLAVNSVDWTGMDVTQLLPLWAGLEDPRKVDGVISALSDPARFWQEAGVANSPADSATYDPTNQNGCGGVWPVWNALLAEGLLEAGRADLASEVFGRLLAAQTTTLKAESGFREGYHPSGRGGLGDRDYVTGIVPLHVLWRLMGFRIVSPDAVAVTGAFALPWPVRVRLHGVTVERTPKGAEITFASGTVKRFRSERPRLIVDESVKKPRVSAPRMQPATAAPGPRKRSAKGVRVPVNKPGRDGSDPFK